VPFPQIECSSSNQIATVNIYQLLRFSLQKLRGAPKVAPTPLLSLRLASIRRCNHCWTSASIKGSNNATVFDRKVEDLGIIGVNENMPHVTFVLRLWRFPMTLNLVRQIEQVLQLLPRIALVLAPVEAHRFRSHVHDTVSEEENFLNLPYPIMATPEISIMQSGL
jgi:hypothetical protein